MKIIFFLFWLCFLTVCSVCSAGQWEEIRGEHFIVYCEKEYEEFARQVSGTAEKYYRSIAEDLGYVRYSNFWKWDKRVKIYIYPDHETYLKATQQQAWSHGMADYVKKEIISYVWSAEFLSVLLPHEITHLIFRDFVGFKGTVPLWLDEGIAQWEETEKKSYRKQMVRQLAQKHMLLSLNEMMRLDIRRVASDEKNIVQTVSPDADREERLELTGADLVSIYYLQSFSLVGFLMERYPSENFVEFSRQLREGRSVSDALRYAYPSQIIDIEELQRQWVRYVYAQ